MSPTVLTAGVQVPSDPDAPIRFDFELHALRIGLVGREHVNRLGDDWRQPGIYVLLGAVGATGQTEVYVGKAVDLRQRLLEHRRNPRLHWWRAMAVVRDTTSGFNSAQIGYLEGRLAQELRGRPAVDVREGQMTVDLTLPAYARAPLEDFVSTVFEALRITGLDLRSEADEGPVSEETTTGSGMNIVRQTIPGTVADLLAAGLIGAGTKLYANRGERSAEAEVTSSGDLVVDGVSYHSPSTAGKKGLGVPSTNGWTTWTTSEGTSLSELRDRLNADDE